MHRVDAFYSDVVPGNVFLPRDVGQVDVLELSRIVLFDFPHLFQEPDVLFHGGEPELLTAWRDTSIVIHVVLQQVPIAIFS